MSQGTFIPLIEAADVSKLFAGRLGRASTLALAGLSLAIRAEKPSIIAVVGESGSGKTTLARLLLGLAEPSGGEVRYRGTDLRRLGHAERLAFRRDVQAIFQDPYGVYNPFYQVDHVLWTPVRRFRLARSRSEARELIGTALRAVGLRPEEILGRFPHQLSGGQRQRVMVARALLLRPKLIVADEPVSMVDASLRATILGSLRQLTDEHGISILYITHDLATAYQVSDAILVMYRANVVEAGAVARVVAAPQHPYTQLLISAIPRAETGPGCVETPRDYRLGRFRPGRSCFRILKLGGFGGLEMHRFIDGEERTQRTLLPNRLEDYVSEENPVRVIEVFIDELDLAALGFSGMTPAATGRPAYHPSTLLKIYLYGYLNRLQSSRRLEREAQRNIELMWLVGRLAPDFKTIADFRRDNGEAIRAVCRQFIILCRQLGLFTRAVIAIDGSKFKAVNNRDKNFTVAKVGKRIEQVDASIVRYLAALDRADREESDVAEAKTTRLKDKIAGLRRQMQRAV